MRNIYTRAVDWDRVKAHLKAGLANRNGAALPDDSIREHYYEGENGDRT